MSRTVKTLGGLGAAVVATGLVSGVVNEVRNEPADGIDPVTSVVARVLGKDVIKKCECIPHDDYSMESGSCYRRDLDALGEWECGDSLVADTDEDLSPWGDSYGIPELMSEKIAAQVSNVHVAGGGFAFITLACALAVRRSLRKKRD